MADHRVENVAYAFIELELDLGPDVAYNLRVEARVPGAEMAGFYSGVLV